MSNDKMKEKEMGGTKHYKYKTQKINFYRKALSQLKKKRANTKTLKTKKQHKLSYLKSKLRTLTAMRSHSKKHRKTHTRARIRARTQKKSTSPTALETIEWNTQKYTSPRVVPILSNSSLSIPPIHSPSPSSSPLSVSDLQSSPTETEINNTVNTAPNSPTATEIPPTSLENSVATDREKSVSLSMLSPPPFPEIVNVPSQVSVGQSTADQGSLRLDDLAVASSSPSNSVNTQQTTVETKSINQ